MKQILFVRESTRNHGESSTTKQRENQVRKRSTLKVNCFRCGKNPSHSREKRPARNSTCNKCSKVGHWAKVCRTKIVAEVIKQNSDYDANYEFLGEVTSQENAQRKTDFKLDRQKVQFKLDTGADKNCIPFHIDESMKSRFPILKKSMKKLHFCDGEKLNICGKFTATIEADTKITAQGAYVTKGLHQALLGGDQLYLH